jgi:hypothetical protein
MHKGWAGAAVLWLGLVGGAAQAATSIGFEEFAFDSGNTTASSYIASGYQGLEWGGGYGSDSWVVSPNTATGWYVGTLEPYAHTGNNFAWSNAGEPLALQVQGGGTFDVQDVWVRSWPDIAFDVVARGFVGGAEVFSQTFSVGQDYAQVSLGFTQISQLTLTVDGPVPHNVLIDDLRVDNITSVPEPESMAMMSAGLLVLGAVARRRRQR